MAHQLLQKLNRTVASVVCFSFLTVSASATSASFPNGTFGAAAEDVLLERAIDGGDPSAMNDVGVFYDDVAENAHEALRWFLKGALAGSKPSKMNLGMALFEGRVFKRDRALALFWMRLAEIDGPILNEGYLVHPSMRRKLSEPERERSDVLFEKFLVSQTIPLEAVPMLPATELSR